MNSSKNILLLILGLVVIVGGIFMLSNGADESEPEEEVEVPENWVTYSTSTLNITHPPEAEVTNEAGYVKIQVLGEDNTPNSEVTDGFTFLVQAEKVSDLETLSSFANGRYESETEILESVEAPTSTTVGNRDAFRYVVESGTGSDSVNFIIEETENDIFYVSYNVSDPNDAGYEDIISTMMTTLELNN